MRHERSDTTLFVNIRAKQAETFVLPFGKLQKATKENIRALHTDERLWTEHGTAGVRTNTLIHHWVEVDKQMVQADGTVAVSAQSREQHLVESANTIHHTVLISHQVNSGFEEESRRKTLGSNTKVKQAVKHLFHMQSPEFFLVDFLKLSSGMTNVSVHLCE